MDHYTLQSKIFWFAMPYLAALYIAFVLVEYLLLPFFPSLEHDGIGIAIVFVLSVVLYFPFRILANLIRASLKSLCKKVFGEE